MAALREHLKGMMSERHPNDHALVFPNDIGGDLTPESMRWSMKAALDGAQIQRRVTLHGLRNAFCTMLAMDGRSALEIAHRAGHAQSSTSERYIHLAEALQVEAPSIVAKLGVGLLDG